MRHIIVLTWRLIFQQQPMFVRVCIQLIELRLCITMSSLKAVKKNLNTLGIQKTNKIIQKAVIHMQIDDKSPNAESCFLIPEVLLLLFSD